MGSGRWEFVAGIAVRAGGDSIGGHPPLGMALPFVLLLAAIALLPLLPRLAHWWESNLHRFYVAAGLAVSPESRAEAATMPAEAVAGTLSETPSGSSPAARD